MKQDFTFSQIQDTQLIQPLKQTWLKSLTAPQDGMWESFIDQAKHWLIQLNQETIGYACVNAENTLLQFYLKPHYLNEGTGIFKTFIQQEKITQAIIGTNNPVCLSLALHLNQSVKVHTYLFEDFLISAPVKQDTEIAIAKRRDLLKLIAFCNYSVGAPEQWLKVYLGDLIDKGEVFMLENADEVVGTCEVRRSASNPNIADLGIIVSPEHRKKGLGTFLLRKAKEIALQWGKSPICSCEKDNLGSLKAIQNNGFRSIHQMVLIGF